MTDARAPTAFGEALAEVLQRHAREMQFEVVLDITTGQLAGLIRFLPPEHRMAVLEYCIANLRAILKESLS